jgi:pimeloyl-ACP methyl ester carboxylesterase
MNMTKLHFLDPNPTGRPTVLLLHGLGADGSSWTLQLPPLIEAGFRPIAPDAPGFGKSPYDGKGWSVRKLVKNRLLQWRCHVCWTPQSMKKGYF